MSEFTTSVGAVQRRPIPSLLSKREVAAILGIHPESVMRLVRLGQFVRPVRLSPTCHGRVRFDEGDVIAWLLDRKEAVQEFRANE